MVGEDLSTSMSGHLDVYVCLVQLSLLPNHIDVQLHTLYKITRNRAELHHKAHILVEAGKE